MRFGFFPYSICRLQFFKILIASFTHVLISITEKIKDFIDSGNYVSFVDLEKAFDIVIQHFRSKT